MTIHKHEYHGDDGFTRVVVQNAVIECESHFALMPYL